jgi:hypothetical protein
MFEKGQRLLAKLSISLRPVGHTLPQRTTKKQQYQQPFSIVALNT